MTTSQQPAPAVGEPRGRRGLHMQEKRTRIFEAAAALFNEHGFDAVTTQQVADRADVAAGTVFRYASSKGELLLMVYNESLREAIKTGRQAADRISDPTDATIALIDPVIAFTGEHPQNSVLYQRELLFGAPNLAYRAEGIGLAGELESAIAQRLVFAAQARGAPTALLERGAARAARNVFAALSLFVAQPSTGVQWGNNDGEELHGQIAQIVLGYLASAGATMLDMPRAVPSMADQTGRGR